MNRCGTVAAFALLTLIGGAALGDEVVTVDLSPAPASATIPSPPKSLTLSDKRPAYVNAEPFYRGNPVYAELVMGDGQVNRICIAVDRGTGNAAPKIYVDANGDGDLTNDPPITLAAEGTVGNADSGAKGAIYAGSTTVTVHYNAPGRAGLVPTQLRLTYVGGELMVERRYMRSGTLTVGGLTYNVVLLDANMDGRFDQYKHGDNEPARVTLLIDKNRDGKFDPATESFDAYKPITLGTRTFEIDLINVRGTHIALRPSDGKPVGAVAVAAGDLKVGNDPIPFDTKTLDGATAHFPKDFKGKVVLLDFWATWCPPCRGEIPHIVQAYNKYHEKGFEILGISLDQPNSEQVLKQFLGQNGMTWAQVYDGGFWNAEIAKLYGVHSIPMAYLVDGTSGKIIAMGNSVRGEGLALALEQALGQKAN